MLSKRKVARMVVDCLSVLLLATALGGILSAAFRDRVRNPLVLLILVPGYFVYANTKPGTFTPACFRRLIVRLAILYSHRSVPAAGRHATSLLPILTFVDDTAIGFVWNGAADPDVHVNGRLWVQRCVQGSTLVIFGLRAATCYTFAVSVDRRQPERTAVYRFRACTRTVDTKLRRISQEEAYTETMETASENLNAAKARLRKLRKDFMKKKTVMRHDLDTLGAKTSAKRRTDERVSKRIQALGEKVKRQELELAALECIGGASEPDLKAQLEAKKATLGQLHAEAAELDAQFDQQKRQLQRELAGAEQQLQAMQLEAENFVMMRDSIVRDYVNELKQRRLETKTARIAVESEYRAAIAGSAGVPALPRSSPAQAAGL